MQINSRIYIHLYISLKKFSWSIYMYIHACVCVRNFYYIHRKQNDTNKNTMNERMINPI